MGLNGNLLCVCSALADPHTLSLRSDRLATGFELLLRTPFLGPPLVRPWSPCSHLACICYRRWKVSRRGCVSPAPRFDCSHIYILFWCTVRSHRRVLISLVRVLGANQWFHLSAKSTEPNTPNRIGQVKYKVRACVWTNHMCSHV